MVVKYHWLFVGFMICAAVYAFPYRVHENSTVRKESIFAHLHLLTHSEDKDIKRHNYKKCILKLESKSESY